MDAPWFRFYEQGVPRAIPVPELTLPEVLDRTAEKHPDHVALRFLVDSRLPVPALTYAELRERSLRFATALFRLGVRKGDRVALVLPNCPQYVVALYGALRLGAIVVNTNPMYVARELREQLEDSGSETVVILDQLLPRLREVQAATRVRHVVVVGLTGALPWPARVVARLVRRWRGEAVALPRERGLHDFDGLVRGAPPDPPGADLSPLDVALLQYTGGTTGTPKAAMLTHRNLVANSLQAAAWFPRAGEAREVFLGVLPLFHVYGFTTVLLFGVAVAAEIVLLPRPRPLELVLEALRRFRATLFNGVPTLYAGLAEHPRAEEYDLRTGVLCVSGAAPLTRQLSERFEALTGGRLVEGYGLTETSPLTHCTPLFGERRTGSMGVPIPGTEARIVDLETGEPLPPGQDGEIAVRGPQVMLGYWQRPEETAEVLRDGWLLTGDVGHMDADGFFYVVDRRKDMIDASGFKVLPREVEEVLGMHQAIAEAVVAGVPDAYRGETVKAYVVLRPGQHASSEEIVDFCRLHLAPFKVPRQVEVRSELPKSTVGKYLRRVLVEQEQRARAAREA
ncbi:MAG: long-chain-fatty-acid--CoA ligase [Betaproteobacteria bacterium]